MRNDVYEVDTSGNAVTRQVMAGQYIITLAKGKTFIFDFFTPQCINCLVIHMECIPTILYFPPQQDRPTSQFQNHRRYDQIVQWIDQLVQISEEMQNKSNNKNMKNQYKNKKNKKNRKKDYKNWWNKKDQDKYNNMNSNVNKKKKQIQVSEFNPKQRMLVHIWKHQKIWRKKQEYYNNNWQKQIQKWLQLKNNQK